MKKFKGGPPSGTRRPPTRERLEVGQRIRNARTRQEGVVLDYACQYAHPKAEPVYSYLIRWDDGQVLAFSEGALGRDGGLEPID